MDKNRKFTVTWNELESLVNGLVTEQLHKYGLLNESMSSSEDDVEDDNEFNYGELQQLIDLYEAGEINSDDEGEDYGLLMYIRHYNRGEIDFSINDLFDTFNPNPDVEEIPTFTFENDRNLGNYKELYLFSS